MNVEEIKELIQTFAESGLEEIEAELDGNRLYLKRSADAQAQVAPANIPGFCPNTVYTGWGAQIGQGLQTGQGTHDVTNGSGGADGIGVDASGTVKASAAAVGEGGAPDVGGWSFPRDRPQPGT